MSTKGIMAAGIIAAISAGAALSGGAPDRREEPRQSSLGKKAHDKRAKKRKQQRKSRKRNRKK